MAIFKELNKKGYKHYYDGTVEELDSMDKDNQHLHSEIMQVIMWLYEKYKIWIQVFILNKTFAWKVQDVNTLVITCLYAQQDKGYNSPTEAYEAAIEYTLENLI